MFVISHTQYNGIAFAECIIAGFQVYPLQSPVNENIAYTCKQLCEEQSDCNFVYINGSQCQTSKQFPTNIHSTVFGGHRLCPHIGGNYLMSNWDKKLVRCELTIVVI